MTKERDAEVRALTADLIAYQGIEEGEAIRQARRAVAIRHGESMDPNDMTSAELQSALGQLIADEPEVLTRNSTAPNDMNAIFDSMSPEDKAALYEANGLTEQDVKDGYDPAKTKKLLAERALQSAVDFERESQVLSLTQRGFSIAEANERAESRKSIETRERIRVQGDNVRD